MTDHNEVEIESTVYATWARLRNRGFLSADAADTGPAGMSGAVFEILREAFWTALPTQPPTEPTRAEDAPLPAEAKRIAEILRKPYHFTVVPDEGSFFAKVQEFPGCFATGDTAPEAMASLLSVAESWLMATIARGQSVPDPAEDAPHVEPGGEREKPINPKLALAAGFVIVPKEPTDAMMAAGYEAMFDGKFDGTQAPMVGAGYDAMLNARPR